MNAFQTKLILSVLYPALQIKSPFSGNAWDYALSSNGISEWRADMPQPSAEFLEDQWATFSQTRSSLVSAWEEIFTTGERALLQPVFVAALRLFDKGDVSGAKDLVEGIPSDLSATLATKRDSVLALFPE